MKEMCDRSADSALVALIGRAGHLADERLDGVLAAHGLSLAKLGVLWQLGQPEAAAGVPLGQLAERLACVRSNVTQLVDRLEADGLVRRVPAPEDRRSIQAVITDAGRARCAAAAQAMAVAEAELVGGLSDAERVQLNRILDPLASRWEHASGTRAAR